MKRFLILIFLIFSILLVFVFAEPCGTIISSSGTTTLTGDVLCPTPTYGIYISVNDVVLDCAGYLINGTNDGTDNTSIQGIAISDKNNVTIKNCNINDFSYGVMAINTSDILILNNNFTQNNWKGIHMYGPNNIIRGNLFNRTINDNSIQIMGDSEGLLIENNSFYNIGNNVILLIGNITNSIIRNNNIEDSEPIGSTAFAIVYYLGLGPDNITIFNNNFLNISGKPHGMFLSGTNFNILSNTFDGCDRGIVLDINAISLSNGGIFAGSAENFTVSGNTITNCNTGIIATNITSLSISDNTFSSVTTKLISEFVYGTSTMDSLTFGTSGSSTVTFYNFDLTSGSANTNSTYVASGTRYFSIDSTNQPGLNTTAVISINDVNCGNFNLYRFDGFSSVLSTILGGTKIADETDKGSNCPNANDCTGISCSETISPTKGTLTFTVSKFSSHGVDGPGVVPEFSTIAIIIAVLGVIGMFFYQRKEE